MAFSGPLVLKANLAIGPTAASAFDVSDQVTAVKFSGTRALIEIPPTGSTDASARAGTSTWSVQIDFLGNDEASTDLTRLFYDALLDDDGELWVEGTMREGNPSSSNPLWGGTFVVSGVGLGGTQEQLFTDSATHRMLAAPSYSFS